jgi:glycosyl transferase family 25
MQFYLINLDRSPERLEWISKRLRELSISPVRVSAVDGKELSSQELAKWDLVRHPRFGMGPGEIACFLSHRRVWQTFVNGDQNWCFVAEDDVHLSDHLPQFLSSDQWLPSDATIVKAETVKQRVWLAPEKGIDVHSHELRVLRSYHGGSAGYFIGKRTAASLLLETEDFCTIPDQLLFNPDFKFAKRLKIYQIDPALAVQDWVHDSPSANKALESLLLAERSTFHGVKQARNKGGVAYIRYKVSNPFIKASRRCIEFAATEFGTHLVKKIAFA